MSDTVKSVSLHEIQVSHRTVWRLVEVESHDGVKGVGECSDTRRPDSARRVLAAIAPHLGGHSTARSPEELDGRLSESIERRSDAGDEFDQRLVIGGLITALCDIWAQRSNLPLGVLLGGSRVDEVALYANINRAPRERRVEEFVSAAQAAKEIGFDRIKLAPFDGPPQSGKTALESGMAILNEVRKFLGSDVTILVDIHHRLSMEELPIAVRELEDLGVGWIEDAVDVRRADHMEWLAGYTEVPLAGGESLTNVDDFAAISNQGHITYLLIDPKYVGGPFRYKTIVESLDSDVTLTHHNPTSPISTATCAQLAMLTRNLGPLEFAFGEPVDRAGLIDPVETIHEQRLVVAPGPGVGVRLVEPLRRFSPEQIQSRSWVVEG